MDNRIEAPPERVVPGWRVERLASGLGCSILCAIACLGSAGIALKSARAATVDAVWLGGTGLWNDPTQWSSNPAYPTCCIFNNKFNAEINSGSVDLNTSVVLEDLTLTGGTIVRSTGTRLETNDVFTWSGGTLTAVPMLIKGSLSIEGPVFLGGGSTLDIPKPDSTPGSGIATQQGGDLFFNPGGGTLQTHSGTSPGDPDSTYSLLDDSGMFSNGGTGTLINFGIFQKIGGTGVSIIEANLLRSDTVNVVSGTLRFGSVDYRLYSANTLGGGVWNVLNGSTLEFSQASAAGGSVIATNEARVVLSGAGARIADAGGNDILSNYLTRNDGYLTIANGASLTVPAAFTNNSNLTVENGANLAAPAGFRNNRNFTIQNGVDFTAPAGSTSGSNATLTIGADSTFSVSESSDYVAAGATILATDTSAIQVDSGHTVSNTGTLRGIGKVQGNLLNSGILQPGFPGQPGALTLQGDFAATSSSTFSIQLGGPTELDVARLSVFGTSTLDGMLDVSLLEGFALSLGDQWVILTSTAGLSGSFINDIIEEGVYTFGVLYEPDQVVLSVTAIPEPGTLLLLGLVLLSIAIARRRAPW